MKCPLCNIEMVITKSRYVLRDSKLYRSISLSCRCEKCPNNGKVIKQLIKELPVSDFEAEETAEVIVEDNLPEVPQETE